jgi:UDP-N-acetylglucosamine--N-acetylmuramyl-(pentapeptide) pyrophosphoryl-undecaprenol N-acetylglucosamine transferase
VWRLLGPRLRGAAPEAIQGPDGGGDPLSSLRAGMEQLAVRDADRRLADLLVALAQGEGARR